MYFLQTSTVSTELVLKTRVNYGLSLESSQAPELRGGYDAHATAGTHPQLAALHPQHDLGTHLSHLAEGGRTDSKKHKGPRTFFQKRAAVLQCPQDY